MKSEYASASSDAITRTRHPRLDFRTEEARRYTARLRPFLKEAVCPGQRVLDLGCGAGKFTFELEKLGSKAVGLDCSQEAIGLAREIATKLNSSAEFHLGFFDKLPFPENSFDAVLFPENIIECSYTEMDLMASQVRFILRKGGKFFIEMRDGLDRAIQNPGSAECFDRVTGMEKGKISVPGEGDFTYETTFWTIAFAHFVVSRYLKFMVIDKIDDKRYLLSFEKQNE